VKKKDVRAVDINITFTLHETHYRSACKVREKEESMCVCEREKTERERDLKAVDINIAFTLHETQHRSACKETEGGEKQR